MLFFFLRPFGGGGPEGRIITEDAIKIAAVVGAVALDHGGGFDDGDEIGRHLGRIEARPLDIVQAPMLYGHVTQARVNGTRTL